MYFRPIPPQRKQAPRKSDFKKFDAPIAGWISNRSLSSPIANGEAQGAAVLDNFFPTATTAVLRRGKELYATLADGEFPVTSIFSYVNGLNRKLFASTENTIYDITNIDTPYSWRVVDDEGNYIVTENGDYFGIQSTVDKEVFENALGGNWIVVQFATTGGIYLIGVNGQSEGFIYDGFGFYPYVDGGVFAISYTARSNQFVAGEVVTGGTSGATATVYEDVESPTAGEGTLMLTGVVGTFQNLETLTGSISGVATAASVETNVVPGIEFPDSLTTADMSYVWVYKNRLWFAQKDSLDIWYMDNADSIGGAPVKYPMGGIFGRGGQVLWGAAWSLDSGASGGLSDQLVIMSSEGEAAVFQGTYPEDAVSWLQVGVYRVGKPLGNRAHFRGGGDIAVATSVGLVPLSKAISLDVTALSQAAISYNIQDAWQNAVNERGIDDWQCELWPDLKMAVISPPVPIGGTDPTLFITNTETGAWCRYTNWDARAMEVFQGRLYFGGPDGKIYVANVTGSDDGDTYTGVYIPLFEDFGTPANRKIAKVGRGVTRSKWPINYTLRFQGDFNMNAGSPPTAPAVISENTWGTGTWGTAVWGAISADIVTQGWKSLGGHGYSASLSYQVTSGSAAPLDVEIIRLEVTFTTAEVVT